jgi:hypothetical protein
VATGHLETEFLAFGASEDEVRQNVGEMKLSEAKAKLDALILGAKSSETTWWDAMRREGSS